MGTSETSSEIQVQMGGPLKRGVLFAINHGAYDSLAGLIVALLLWLASYFPGGATAFQDFVSGVSFVHPVLIISTLLLSSLYFALDGATIRPILRVLFRPLVSFLGHSFGIASGASIAFIFASSQITADIPAGLRVWLATLYAASALYAHLSIAADDDNGESEVSGFHAKALLVLSVLLTGILIVVLSRTSQASAIACSTYQKLGGHPCVLADRKT